ncbi:phosphatidylinositol kinase [Pilimelia terevasa]|uniref:Phosphatidylinositol kinase n=1 Tax=Pilimelia terevasa TaxID=53372 RepID=A0A8J3BUX1_9ACTN|nr:SCO1664 family protein [Pilimelia terevasa]GGK42320.1 phosphatidylinositol kinase [Pilimelia terevasa]
MTAPPAGFADGVLHLTGRLTEASNTTLYGHVATPRGDLPCVYKPVRGERPLWDFPNGSLAGREVAAYLVAEAAGWPLVPPTVLRDGPLGPGSCQLWVADADAPPVGFVPADEVPGDWLPVLAARDEDGRPYVLAHADDPALATLAVFDVLVNNADRKGGHVLRGADGHLVGVDHGLCFHREDKLRTVLWGWAGRPLPARVRADLRRLATALTGPLAAALAAHLRPAEIAALAARTAALEGSGVFPPPPVDRTAIPWPPM